MPIDMSAAKAPPRKTTAGTRAPRSTPVPAMSDRARRTEGLLGLAQLGQGILMMARQYADAATVGMHGPGLVKEVATLADDFEILANGVDFLIKVGPFGGLIAVAVPFALQLAANHKMIDASKIVGANIVPPEVLEAQMRAQILQMQAEAKEAERQAMEDMRAAQFAYEKAMQPVDPEVNPEVQYREEKLMAAL